MSTSVLLVAGEASADRHAARVLSSLGERRHVEAFGLGGAELESAGARLIADLRETTSMGTIELFPRLPHLAQAFTRISLAVARRVPRLAVLVDLPDFNLPLARLCHARGIPVLWYVGPQVWAWRRGRLRTLARVVDHTALVLPFELPLYLAAGAPASFVGHPLLDEPVPDRGSARAALGIGDRSRVAALLPGSRPAEIAHHLPALARAARLLGRSDRSLRFLLPVASSLSAPAVARAARGAPIELRSEGAPLVLAAADVALVATGTATLETVRAGVPAVFFHRGAAVTWALGRALVRIDHLALPNLVLGRRAFPELWQDEVTSGALAREAERLLEQDAPAARQRAAATEVVGKLGSPGAARRVADLADRLLAAHA